MRVGLVVAGGMAPVQAVELAEHAEAAGLDSFWVTEGAGGDAFALLAAAAVRTSRISLGTAVANVYSRTATTLGHAAVTVAELSCGRFALGLGTSHDEQVADEHGLERARPLQHMKDVVTVIRHLDRDSEATQIMLPTLTIASYRLNFTREQSGMPVYVAATGEKMTEWAATAADGVISIWQTPLEIARIRQAYSDLRVVSVVHCALGESIEAGQAALAAARQRHARFRNYRRLFERQQMPGGVAWKSPAELESALSAYKHAGLAEAILMPLAIPPGDAYAAARSLLEVTSGMFAGR